MEHAIPGDPAERIIPAPKSGCQGSLQSHDIAGDL